MIHLESNTAKLDRLGPFRFTRLAVISPAALLAHLRDPRVARHLPLLPPAIDEAFIGQLVQAKEECWERDGLGHWAILRGDDYVGWGGFQREGDAWDFGLVLRPAFFRQGHAIAVQAFEWARLHTKIEEVTFLLPLSRSERALTRLGARPLGTADYAGTPYRKWSLRLEALLRYRS
ncbi:GNAT family N-acetyltransferase [Aurantiacibacter gilvus]|uniref:GNAT family N-acetyltransferase n=1 Tax=Aurantiacibacter gilvus TaxID=3139141 RepID=A0ABU9IFS7_9SPHN